MDTGDRPRDVSDVDRRNAIDFPDKGWAAFARLFNLDIPRNVRNMWLSAPILLFLRTLTRPLIGAIAGASLPGYSLLLMQFSLIRLHG